METEFHYPYKFGHKPQSRIDAAVAKRLRVVAVTTMKIWDHRQRPESPSFFGNWNLGIYFDILAILGFWI